ncbi:MAG: diguanylate cyclase [Burkholderiales bacterium]|nr:diguanylate cyclase [Burkholderiales bacterium]
MLFAFRTSIDPLNREAGPFRPGAAQLLIATAVCLTVISAGTLIINLQARELEARRKVELLESGSSLRARLSRELNRVLYLTGGLSSYFIVRHQTLERSEVEDILAAMYRESKHVRNFAIAVGHRVTYIYPLSGNEKALGLNYPDVPDQWPAIKRIIENGKSTLIGPVNLVQGGSALIYRVPLYINGRYWGLLSSVIDSKSFLDGALADQLQNGYALAIRGKDGQGMQGAVFWGDAGLFDSQDVQLIDMEVPGGKWVLALQTVPSLPGKYTLGLLYGLVWLLALTLGWSTLVVLAQRTKLAHLALFDALTSLPNRMLIDDRISRAMSGLRRDPSRSCLLLFVDLDRFKQINDQFGHRAGDYVLQSTAQRISDTVREIDTVGRWGGDEYVVFMEHVERSKIPDLCEKIRQAVEQPTPYAIHQLEVGASIGYALAPDDGNSLDDLLRVADQRMYANKASRNAVR